MRILGSKLTVDDLIVEYMIAKLKDDLKRNNNNNYTTFKGNVETENYVLNYKSPLFRDNNAILANSIAAVKTAITAHGMILFICIALIMNCLQVTN